MRTRDSNFSSKWRAIRQRAGDSVSVGLRERNRAARCRRAHEYRLEYRLENLGGA